MSQNPILEDSEISLSELFAILWSYKFLIMLFAGLSLLLSGYHALTTEKKFTAQAIFQIEQNNNSSKFNYSEDFNALASLAGFATGSSNSNLDVLLERLTGREFIINMKDKLLLEHDPFFNSYNPDYKDPYWKALIKQIIGWQKTDFEKKAIIERNVLDNYRSNVKFEKSQSGSVSILVTHVNFQKSSKYANDLMEEIRRLVEEEAKNAQDLRLGYLSETLADALQEMEQAQVNLKDYTLKNSAMAKENFISDSLELDQIRMEKRKVVKIANLSIIENLIKSGNLDSSSYETLRTIHPLVDDIEFRRILGMSETISAWAWPDIESIVAVSTTLQDRINRLDVDIKNIEENAKIYAKSAESLEKLQRDAKIAEATYTVLIEQVKSQSLAAGFQPETFKVFEYATPPLSPSSPNRKLTLAIGSLLGIVLGVVISLISGLSRNVFYTRATLLAKANASLTLKSKPIKRLARKTFAEIVSLLPKRRLVELNKALIKLANKKIIYVINTGGQPSSSNTARLLALNSARSGKNILLCDTTGYSEKEIRSKSTQSSSDLPTISVDNNVSVLKEVDGVPFFISKDLNSSVKNLTARFDQVFVCASNKNANTGLMALSKFDPSLVVIASLRRTKSQTYKI